MRLASDTPSLRSMSVPSDLQRGRETLLVVVVALIRWAAMFLGLRPPAGPSFKLSAAGRGGGALSRWPPPPDGEDSPNASQHHE
ncbi:hypothetical protein EYF80_015704 [Liparis tanakae]|uniref:Uncharacterized protein n=1 Tax=Liparis tanakae TaxID=230148 RepID=A0A4Z2IA94_9TELE|nr:hypothetical protein EYF80_015704 [Liparis tanakae]